MAALAARSSQKGNLSSNYLRYIRTEVFFCNCFLTWSVVVLGEPIPQIKIAHIISCVRVNLKSDKNGQHEQHCMLACLHWTKPETCDW